jgi:hypothetical protein
LEQRLCVGDERARVDGPLRLDLGRQLGRPDVRVDEPLDMAPELQPQAEVPLREGLGR